MKAAAFLSIALAIGPSMARPAVADEPPKPDPRVLDFTRGNVKSAGPTRDPRRSEARTEADGVPFEGPRSALDWEDRAEKLRDHLRVTLGLWPMPDRADLHPRVVGTVDRDGYAIDRVCLETLPGFFLSGNLYRPTGDRFPGRRPAVLCPHGHWPEGRFMADVQARCVHLAREMGCVVFVYDMVGYGDSKPFGHAFASDPLRRRGLGLSTLQTWNGTRALDWITARGDVDPAKVAMTGESGGATQTILLAAIDPRVKVVAPVVMVSDGYQGGCTCENAPGLRLGIDNVSIAALAAPRPLKLVGASGDWTARTMTNALASLQLVYAQVGAPNRLSADVFDFPHNYNRTSRDAVYAFLGRWLVDPSAGAKLVEGDEPRTEPADVLAVFDDRSPRPAEAKTPRQVEADLIASSRETIESILSAKEGEVGQMARRRFLDVAHRVRVPIDPLGSRDVEARSVRKVDRADVGVAIEHWTVGPKAEGIQIPAVVVRPRSPRVNGRAVTIVVGPAGKGALASADGSPSPIARALLDRGHSVVGFDPFLVGESLEPDHPAEGRPGNKFLDVYNPSLPLDRMRDLAAVVAWASTLPDASTVNLVATGEPGVLALLALPRLRGVSRAAVDLGGFGFDDEAKSIAPGVDLPGVLQFGGLEGAAILAAPTPLWVAGAGGLRADRPADAYRQAGAAGQVRVDRGAWEPEAVARWVDSGDFPGNRE